MKLKKHIVVGAICETIEQLSEQELQNSTSKEIIAHLRSLDAELREREVDTDTVANRLMISDEFKGMIEQEHHKRYTIQIDRLVDELSTREQYSFLRASKIKESYLQGLNDTEYQSRLRLYSDKLKFISNQEEEIAVYQRAQEEQDTMAEIERDTEELLEDFEEFMEELDEAMAEKAQEDLLKDILGEIVSHGRKISERKLVCLAAIVDLQSCRDLRINSKTVLKDDYFQNKQIEQLDRSEYRNRRVQDPKLKELIGEIYEKYRNWNAKYLVDEIIGIEFEKIFNEED